MKHDHSPLLRLVLGAIALSQILVGCGSQEPSAPKIYGGGYVPEGSQVPAVGIFLRSEPEGSHYRTKTCTGARVAERVFLTSGLCLATFRQHDEKLLFLTSGTGKRFANVTIEKVKTHPDFSPARPNTAANLGLFQISSVPEGFDEAVPIAPYSFEKIDEDMPILAIGAGCDKIDQDGACLGSPTITKGLKYLETTATRDSSEVTQIDESFFISNPEDGRTAEGDMGGPVFNQAGELIGINGFASGLTHRTSAYIWLGSPQAKHFALDRGFSSTPESPTPLQKEAFERAKVIYDALETCGYDAGQHSLFRSMGVEEPTRGLCTVEGKARRMRIKTLLASASAVEMALEAERKGDKEKAYELLKASRVFLTFALDIGIGLSPLGKYKDGLECLVGYSAIPSFSKLSGAGRLFSCAGVILVNKSFARAVYHYMESSGLATKAVLYASGFKRLFSKSEGWAQTLTEAATKLGLKTKQGAQRLGTALGRAGLAGEKAAEALKKLRLSPTLRKTVTRASRASRPLFYVNSAGEAIPSTGFRYVRSDAPYLDSLSRSGYIPEIRPTAESPHAGTYVSFDLYEDAAAASEKLQVPHDAAIRVEFDTLQVIDDIRIPRGKWGTADWLEPLTRDHPQFGAGGATQAVTNSEIQAHRVVDLRTGEVLYESK